MPEPDARRGGGSPLREWHRDYEEGKIAGVCAGVASALDFNVTAVRAVFLLLAIVPGFHAFGLLLYLVLWLIMPPEPGAPSALDRVVDAVSNLVGETVGKRDEPPRRSRDDWEV